MSLLTVEPRRLRFISIIIALTLFIDLTTKAWARARLAGHVYTYFSNFIVLEHSENPGAFLSLGASLSPEVRFWIFTVLIAGVTFGVLYYVIKTKELSKLATLAYTMVVAGGLGNLVDRIMKETVTDFMNIGIGSLRTGIFNVADMGIMAGVFILLYLSFQKPETSQ